MIAKKLLTDTTQLFVQYESRAVNAYELLSSQCLLFGQRQNSAIVHEKLKSRKMKRDETPLKYLYEMLAIAEHSDIEIEAIITYVIQGLPGSVSEKNYMYEATTLQEFKKNLTAYELQTQLKVFYAAKGAV